MDIRSNLNLNSNQIQNLGAPSGPTDVITKGYVDGADTGVLNTSTAYTNVASGNAYTQSVAYTNTVSGSIIAYSTTYTNTASSNVVNYATTYTNTASSNLVNYVNIQDLSRILAHGTSSGIYAINMNNNKITSVATPTLSGDASNKNYIDAY